MAVYGPFIVIIIDSNIGQVQDAWHTGNKIHEITWKGELTSEDIILNARTYAHTQAGAHTHISYSCSIVCCLRSRQRKCKRCRIFYLAYKLVLKQLLKAQFTDCILQCAHITRGTGYKHTFNVSVSPI